MKKLGSFISFVCIVNLLTIIGLLGFLVTTGRLDKTKAQALSDLLRHQGTPDDLRGKLYNIMTPASQPATGPGATGHGGLASAPGEIPGSAEERIDYVRRVLEQERLTLENEKQFLRDQQKLLEQRQEVLTSAEAAFAEEKKVFEKKLASTNTGTDDSGFQKSVALLDELKPKQIKDLLMAMTPEESTRYLSAMDTDRVGKVMAEFKTEDEKGRLKAVLEKVRGANKGSGTGAASANPAGALSSASPGKAGL